MDFLRRLLASLRAGYLAFVAAFFRGARALGNDLVSASRSVDRAVSPVVPAQWKQRIALLFVTGLAFVPIAYSGNMTWSFNDPSGHLNHITAAVVDEDSGATATSPDGSTRHIDVGREFTDRILHTHKNTVYTFVETDRATAERGLADGTYGAIVEVPDSFSADVASLGGDPSAATPALLTVKTNDSVNYVGGNFTKSVATALKQSLNASVLEQYLDNVYIGFTTIHDHLAEAADGAGRLVDGSTQLANGASDLADSSDQLADGARQVNDGSGELVVGLQQIDTGADSLHQGTAQLADGSAQLSDGLRTLDSRSPELRDGSATLADSAARLSDGSTQLADGATRVADGTQQLDNHITNAERTAQDLGIDRESVERTSTDLRTTVDQLASLSSDLDASLAGPEQDAADLATAADTQAGSIDTLAGDARALADASAQRSADAAAITDGANTLSDDVSSVASAVADADAAAPQHTADAASASDAASTYTKNVDALAAQCLDSGADPSFCDSLTATANTSQDVRDQTSTVSDQARAQQASLDTAAATGADLTSSTGTMTDAAQRLAALPTTADSLATAAESLRQPAHDLADGTSGISSALNGIRDTAGQDRPDPETVRTELDTVLAALPDAYDRAAAAADGVHRLNAGAHQVDDGAQQLADGSGQLADGAGTLRGGIDQYTDGVSTADHGAQDLSSGAAQLEGGADRLSRATGQAADGARTLHEGTERLADGSGQLADGAGRLDEGAAQLADGTAELSDGLHSGLGQVPTYTDGERAHLEEAASDPVHLDLQRINGLDRFGEGLAPLFLSISLWVGGMAIFLLMPPFAENALRRGSSIVALLAGGLLPALLLGAVQAVVAVTMLHELVGISAVHLGWLYAMACLTAVVFVALNHGFGAIAGPVGKFIALVLVAVQISGAGGTYPVGTLPGFFRTLHPYLPMTHTVDAFRGAIGGGWVDPEGDIAWMLGWLAIAVLLGAIGAGIQRLRTQRDPSGAIPVDA